MQEQRTDHTYEVWSSTAVGPVCTGWYSDEEPAVERYRYLQRAHAANGFGGKAWLTRDGEDFDPDA